jgi:hypothetical protein
MFSLNHALQHIEAAEPDVVAVYRSCDAVFIAPEGQKKQLCDAFLCVVRERGERERVYAALYLNGSKETLVYTAPPTLSPAEASERIQEGLSFLEAKGYRLEQKNLGGSAALRETIIKNIKVFRPSCANGNGATKGQGAASQEPKTAPSPERELPVRENNAGSVGAAELAKLQAELERLRKEKSALEAETSTRIATLASELAEAKAELAALRCHPATDNELASLQEEYDALRAEYSLINDELAERNASLLQLRSEKAAAQDAAAELAGLKGELERLKAERAGAPYLPSGIEGSAESQPAMSFPQADAEDSLREHGGIPSGDEPIQFRLDNALAAIPCEAPDEVIELRVSFNTVCLSDGASNPKNCSAYICGVERNGSKQIYLALHQTESRKSLIFVPSRQPSDAADYDRVMDQAITFADVTGFITNLSYLGGSPAEREKVIQQIPVFSRA